MEEKKDEKVVVAAVDVEPQEAIMAPMPLFAVLLDVIPKIEDGELAKMSTKPGLDGPNKEAKDLDAFVAGYSQK